MPSHMKCSFNKCTNTSRNKPHLSFHKFPINETTCQQWVELSGNEQIIEKFKNRGPSAVTKTFRVCSEHFKRNDYARFTDKKRLLFKGSVPTVQPNGTTHVGTATRLNDLNVAVENDMSWSQQTTTDVDHSDSSEDNITFMNNLIIFPQLAELN